MPAPPPLSTLANAAVASSGTCQCYLKWHNFPVYTVGFLLARCSPGGGGTDLERWYGDVRPWRPPFHASPAARKGPISSKRVSSQDPLLRKFGNFSLYSLNFHPNFSSQAPKFGNFSAHKPPNLEVFSSQAPKFGIFRSQAPLFRGKCQFASPTLRKSGPHTPTSKKVVCAPPPPGVAAWTMCVCVCWDVEMQIVF